MWEKGKKITNTWSLHPHSLSFACYHRHTCTLPQTHLHLPCVNNFFPLLLPACNFPKNNQGSSNNHYSCLIMVAQIGDIMLIKGTIRGMMVKTTKAKMALVKHTSQTGVEVLFKSFLGCLAQG